MPEMTLYGATIAYVDDITPEQIRTLGEALTRARAACGRALLQTQSAILALERNLVLPPTYASHLRMNFRITEDRDLLPTLRLINIRLQTLTAGLRSPSLRISQYQPGLLVPQDPMMKAYVQKNLSQLLSLGCLNADPSRYKNPNDIVLKFEFLKFYAVADVTATLIHEATHKFLDTWDLAKTPPWKHAEAWRSEFVELTGLEPQLPTAWRDLNSERALHNAYSWELYVAYMPESQILQYGEIQARAQVQRQDPVHRHLVDALASRRRAMGY